MVTVTHWHVHPWFRGPRVLLGVRCKLHPKTQSPSTRGLPPDRVPRRAGRARARGTAYPRAPRRVLEATASEGPVGLLPARGRRTGPPCSRVGLESRGRRPRTGLSVYLQRVARQPRALSRPCGGPRGWARGRCYRCHRGCGHRRGARACSLAARSQGASVRRPLDLDPLTRSPRPTCLPRRTCPVVIR